MVTPRPLIFISAVSRELRSARQLVANTLTFLGYQPVWQDIFGTESGDLREMLRKRIDQCKGVVQLVGKCYGTEPPTPDETFGRVSYTQYEALYARSRGQKVWYLFIGENFPADQCETEAEELQNFQREYRNRLQSDSHVFQSLTTTEGLEASVLKLRDDLTRLRRGVKQWAVAVGLLLVMSVALGVWVLQRQQQTSQQLTAMSEKLAKMQEGLMKYAEVETKVRQQQPGQKPDEVEDRTYADLAKELGLDPKVLREKLPKFAEQLKHSPEATNFERANAAYVAKDYTEAEHLASQAANDARKAGPLKPKDILQALELAGLAAQKHIEYARSMEHFREAEKLTDRDRNPKDWAEVQYAIADLLVDQGQYSLAEKVLRGVVEVRSRVLGPEHRDTLRSRNRFAYALNDQGKYAEAETELRKVIKLEEKILGPEDPDTLSSRYGLTVDLSSQGKFADAEAEGRKVLKLREKVLGPEHPDTLRSWMGLTVELLAQGKDAESEAEQRKLIKVQEKVLGPEHPATLRNRMNLANNLGLQGKYAEAETEEREIIKIQEKVLGLEHPDTLWGRMFLAMSLGSQGKDGEAEVQFRELVKLNEKVVGPEHPATRNSRHGLAIALMNQGKYAEAESQFRELITLDEKVSGPEKPGTLGDREGVAIALASQGKYAEAESQFRELIKLYEKVVGPENPETLLARANLGWVLNKKGKYSEAETEVRSVINVQLKVIVPEPDVLNSRDIFADALHGQGKYNEAETEYRNVIKLKEEMFGPEHRDTLDSRSNLDKTLIAEGKDAEADLREVIRLREKVIGPQHPDTLESCYILASGLARQNKIPEATAFAQRAAEGAHKVLGADHPFTKKYEKLLAELQGQR